MKPANRTNDLAAIHIAQKALGLSKDDAEQLKRDVIGKASAADMTAAERRKLLAHLSTLQAQAKPKPAGRQLDLNRPAVQRSPDDWQDDRWRKARALWGQLAYRGHVRIDTDAALLAYVARQTKMEHWRFCNTFQINKVIETLKRWCLRAGVEIAHG